MKNRDYPIHQKFDLTDTPDESVHDMTDHAQLEDEEDPALSQIDVVDAETIRVAPQPQIEEKQNKDALAGLREYIKKIGANIGGKKSENRPN